MVEAFVAGNKRMTRRLVSPQPDGAFRWHDDVGYAYGDDPKSSDARIWRPRFQPGDKFYVAERHWRSCDEDGFDLVRFEKPTDTYNRKWRCFGGIFMRREWARYTGVITAVRVERLQDISEEDAKAEGVSPVETGYTADYRRAFACLWESIHGDGSWALNPWVWCFTIERTK